MDQRSPEDEFLSMDELLKEDDGADLLAAALAGISVTVHQAAEYFAEAAMYTLRDEELQRLMDDLTETLNDIDAGNEKAEARQRSRDDLARKRRLMRRGKNRHMLPPGGK